MESNYHCIKNGNTANMGDFISQYYKLIEAF